MGNAEWTMGSIATSLSFDYAKLPLEVYKCENVCVHGDRQWTGITSRVNCPPFAQCLLEEAVDLTRIYQLLNINERMCFPILIQLSVIPPALVLYWV